MPDKSMKDLWNKRHLPLEPAMKPNIKAFSGRVTLLEFLNISCASNIWSFCKHMVNWCEDI